MAGLSLVAWSCSVITRRSVLLAGGVGCLARRLTRGQRQSELRTWRPLGHSHEQSAALAVSLGFRQATIRTRLCRRQEHTHIGERSAEGHAENLGELARALVASNVDVIVAPTVATSSAARLATNHDPDCDGARGRSCRRGADRKLGSAGRQCHRHHGHLSFGGKHVELIRELVPRAVRLAILDESIQRRCTELRRRCNGSWPQFQSQHRCRRGGPGGGVSKCICDDPQHATARTSGTERCADPVETGPR